MRAVTSFILCGPRSKCRAQFSDNPIAVPQFSTAFPFKACSLCVGSACQFLDSGFLTLRLSKAPVLA
jgi:hypothetical protein